MAIIRLPHDWHHTEVGNTMLETGEGNMVAWLTLPGDPGTGKGPKLADNPCFRLQVSYCPDNHSALNCPDNHSALNVRIVALSDAQLAEHINHNCQGWLVRRDNIEGIKIGAGMRVAEDTEDSPKIMVCLECEQPLGAHHDPGCGKRIIGCPEVVMDDCVDDDEDAEDTADDEAEQQRRDEKHGLYGQHEDVSN